MPEFIEAAPLDQIPAGTAVTVHVVGKVFIAAFTLDRIYELMVWRRVYPTQAILVALQLAIVPYLLVRGPATRIARRFIQTKNGKLDTQP